MKGRIHSFESMGLVDGPGVRAVVFMQGCRLRCKYCHNPDTWNMDEGYEIEASDLVKKISRFKPYFGDDGGITFSGGEPLMQPEFLLECLKLCHAGGIHTCIDTAGQAAKGMKEDIIDEILNETDLILFDIKHVEESKYRDLTGGNIKEAEGFLGRAMDKKIPLWLRHVVVPGITDSKEHVEELKKYINTISGVEKIQLLPYHKAGEHKYKELGIKYELTDVPAMGEKETKEMEKELGK